MTSLIVIIALTLLAIVIGKHTRRVGLKTYLLIMIIALAQVGFVLLMMFTMPRPTP